MSKKIFIFSQSLLKGGAEKQAVLLATLLKHKYDVNFIIYYEDKIDIIQMNKLNGINVKILNGSHIHKIFQIFSIIKSNSFLFNYLLLPNLLGGIISKFKKNIISFGGIRSSRLEKRKVIIEKLVHNYINNYTIFNNKSGISFCKNKGFNVNKMIFVPNAIFPIFEYKNKDFYKNSHLEILSVGRFEEVKNYPFALDVVKELILINKKIKYTIIGWGSKEFDIRKKIDDLGISKYVKLIINPSNLNDYYEKSDLFLQTSKFEGISNTILEAMSFGLPIIATNVGDNKFIVRNEKDGFIINEGELSTFVNKINLLSFNKKKLENLSNSSYLRVKENFSSSNFVSRYNDLIEKNNTQ